MTPHQGSKAQYCFSRCCHRAYDKSRPREGRQGVWPTVVGKHGAALSAAVGAMVTKDALVYSSRNLRYGLFIAQLVVKHAVRIEARNGYDLPSPAAATPSAH